MLRDPARYSHSSALVALAVAALRDWVGVDATRTTARRALHHWQHEKKLTFEQRLAVLGYFESDTGPQLGIDYLAPSDDEPRHPEPFVAELLAERFGVPVRERAA